MRKVAMAATLVMSCVVWLGASQPGETPFYTQHNLVSDGAVPADLIDSALVNSWGLVATATSPWWIADNATGLSTLYNGNTGAKLALTVTVPGAPTGIVSSGGSGFVVSNGSVQAPARFIFASEDGTISGWNSFSGTNTMAFVAVDNSPGGAVYKGLALASTLSGDFLFATNFRAGTVDVFDSTFSPVPGGFADPSIPEGYAPFGIQNIGGMIFVTYALQDADKEDDVPGEGHGFINAFDTAGNLLGRVASKGPLNSPWGLALAPDGFGRFSGDLLVGNFGDGRIHAFDPTKLNGQGEFQQRGPLHSERGAPIEIEGLWGLGFGNGAAAGPRDVLFFTAGPSDEQHGLFGSLVPVEPGDRH